MAKKLGIDLGSSSLGWFLRENDEIIANGVITFDTGMKKDQGGYTSPTKDRRLARSKRRLIQARKYRKIELLKILVEYGLVPLSKDELDKWYKYRKGNQRIFPETEKFKKWLACDFTYIENGKKYKNPYELRATALDNKVHKHELGRALYHIVQRRGYKDIGEKDNETEKQIKRRDESGFKIALEKHKYLSKALKNEFIDKGKRARNQYPYRLEYEQELIRICETQGFDISKNEQKEFNDEFVKKVWKSIIWQRPLRSQKGNIGKCSLEPAKFRCPASHPIFEIYRTWSYINTIKTVEYIDEKHTEKHDIPLEFKKDLFQKVFLTKSKNFKFETIQKHLDKLFKVRKEYNYLNKSTGKYDSSVSGMPVSKGLIDIFGEKIKEELEQLHTYEIGTKEHAVVGKYSVYDIWHLIFDTDDDHLEDFAINKLGVKSVIKKDKKGNEYSENPVVKLKNSAFSTSYADLSVHAMKKIIPFLKDGFLYNQAVLMAKIPDLYPDWQKNKELIYEIIKHISEKYADNKAMVNIANNLIDKYKSLTDIDKFAHKNFNYKLDERDYKDIEKACISYFGKITWNEKDNKQKIINQVAAYYQSFFADTERKYIEVPTLSSLLKQKFEENNLKIDIDKLYHHSHKKNIYPKPVYSRKYDKEILAVPLIDSIKNPMFNKSMSILRRLINELIVNEYVDEDGVIQPFVDENTEIIIEIARELNDNNKRIAIERYQRERRDNREKYRQFVKELKGENLKNENEAISKFELWAEQVFVQPDDTKNINKNVEILKEKNAIKRYELWSEQKGQCMYTGKMINISQLFTPEIEIEHTIPRSLLPDNTMANLTVCYSRYNSDVKNNKMPTACPNYEEDTKEGTAIKPRLKAWEEIRDRYKKQYEDRKKPKGIEDENAKNKRIQEKHYYKMHFDYWKDKVHRFTTKEIKDNWVRRQLTDTQMVSKYAREFLKTYFKKVSVQKGKVTADYRKIFGFQPEDEIKSRNKHTHHSIDAAVLTLIPTNSSKRVAMLQKMYELKERGNKQYRANPDGFTDFNAQNLINLINNNTLIVNYKKDKITEQTYRNVRKRGKIQYLKRNGQYVLDEKGNKIPLVAKGTTIRGKLFQETFIGKIKNVEKDEKGKPKRNSDGSWKYLSGKDEFSNVVRKPITEAKIDDIVDESIKNNIKKQLEAGISRTELKDHQGKNIRHVRVKTKAGKVVKNRLNYKSKHDYKNKYYAAAGEIPYAIFITNIINGRLERKMIPVAIHEVAQTFKEYHKFTPELYLKKFHLEELKEKQDIKLLKVGQKVFVLNDDSEYKKRKDIDFQTKRMYKITQFSDGNIWLKYHLEAQDVNEIKKAVKEKKHLIVYNVEKELGLLEVKENKEIKDIKKRKKDFEDRLYKFGLKDYRLNRILKIIGEQKTRLLLNELNKYKAFSSKIEIEGETPLLKTSKNNWNFIYENYDFTIDLMGEITWVD